MLIKNDIYDINDLDFTEEQKAQVLVWFARKMYVLIEEGSSEPDYYGKSYDPLTIDMDNKIGHSYVFDLEDGGRHHSFKNLEHLEKMLMDEGIKRIKELIAMCP